MVVRESGLVLAGRYRLAERLSVAEEGAVWRAHDEEQDRPVAARQLSPPAAAGQERLDQLADRAGRRAEQVALVEHPGVVPVEQVLVEDGALWTVTPLLDARSLADVLATGGPMASRPAAALGVQLADVLVAAHRVGVPHGGLRGTRIFLGQDGQVYVAGFDVAVDSAADADATTDPDAGERGAGVEGSAAGDLDALGRLLHAVVTGGTGSPENGDQQAPDPERGVLLPVLRQLCAEQPQNRPDASAARRMLAFVVRASPAAAQPTPPPPPTPHASPVPPSPAAPTAFPVAAPSPATAQGAGARRWLGAWIAVGAVALVALVGGATYYLTQRQDDTQDRARGQQPTHAAHQDGAAGSGEPSSAPPTRPSSPSPSASTVPEGYRKVRDAEGFTVVVPEEWDRATYRGQVDYRSDDGATYLRIGESEATGGSVRAHFAEMERKASRSRSDYSRKQLRSNRLYNRPGALWDFTYTDPEHGPVRAVDQGFVTKDGREFAIYLTAPARDWKVAKRHFEVAVRSFRAR